MRTHFSRIEEALEAIAEGQVLIVVDSEDREDEGDFFIAAERVTADAIHFMITHGRGQLCMPVTPDIAARLALQPMASPRGNGEQPRFALPLDLRSCRSGISPVERAQTIQAMIDPSSRPEDFVCPGHVFPLLAQPGGVLSRSGHTEASVDLSRFAGLTPAGLLCEICSSDGMHMAGRTELADIARRFGLHMVAIDDLIEYRKRGSNGKTSRDAAASPGTWRSIGTTL